MTETDERDYRSDARAVLNIGVRVHPVDVAGWHSLNAVPMGEPGETASVWELAAARLRVLIAECSTVDEAHARLKESLDSMMRPDVPRGEELAIALGDASYVVVDDAGIPGAARFVRGNLFVAVDRANDVPADAVQAAAAIDRMLLEPPPGSARTLQVPRGERVVVVPNVREAVGGRIHVVATGGRFAVEGDALVFDPGDADVDSVTLTVGD